MRKANVNAKTTHKVKTTTYVSLPPRLVDDIKDLKLSKENTNYCYKFVGLILRNNWMNNRNIDDYSEELSVEFIKKSFNGKLYTNWLYPLLESEIVIRDEFYRFGDGGSKVLFYKINLKYFLNIINSNILIGDNQAKPLISLGYSDINKLNTKDMKYLKWFKNDMEELTFDRDKLNKIVQDKITHIGSEEHIKSLKINCQIEDKNIPMVFNGQTYNFNRNNLIEKVNKQNLLLIKDGKHFSIDTLEAYISKKKLFVDISYSNSIKALLNQDFRATRNETNNRLDTNITNLSSDLTDEICIQNNLIQIDLKNSQFAILSHILSTKLDTDDFKRFKALSVSGQLYDYIKDNLGLETRKQGKIAMFEILFSSRNNNTSSKKKLKELFPTVIKWIDDYKEENGDENFSVMLQQTESSIFIDTILTKVKSKHLFCLTKHDSVIVRESDKDKVMKIIQDHFTSISFQGEVEIK